MLHRNVLYSDICRCEESPSSPGVSSSIGDGIIEEDEDEGEEESNKKKMKEDDQEVLSLPLVARLCVCSTRKITELFVIQMKKESLFTWRVELSKTEKYWEGWFRGLSSLFLTCPVPKLLLLAGEISV